MKTREEKREAHRIYCAAHPEIAHKYYLAHAEHIKEKQRQWYKAHREEKLAKAKEYYQKKKNEALLKLTSND